MVTNQAITIWRAIFHLTPLILLAAPTPIMEDDTTWVVLTGMPRVLAPYMTREVVKSAAKPLIGSMRNILPPMVRIMRHPPKAVPADMAKAQAILAHKGTVKVDIIPAPIRLMVMIPMDF